MKADVESWGRNPKVKHRTLLQLLWRDALPDFSQVEGSILPFGMGKSYGDSCLNDDNALLLCAGLNKVLLFDKENAIFRCEAGVRFDEILRLIVPHGFFLPVTPGTKLITVGGAIANDVHGKNHHRAGTFGCHVTQFELLRSDGTRTICSADSNPELFSATIGGLGLTGVILWAEFKLTRIASPFIYQHSFRFKSLDEYMDKSRDADSLYDYVVSWVDCTSEGSSLGRGIFMGGNFAHPAQHTLPVLPKEREIALPFNFPPWALNKLSVRAFNELFYAKHWKDQQDALVHFDPFFYPLDAIHHWNRMYGARGFFQYQFVVPFDSARDVIRDVLKFSARSGKASFLSVLKNFGDVKSPGLLSFPRPGVTLSMDFKNEGKKTLELMNALDGIISSSGGVLYPAKDARMSASDFQRMYPRWEEFRRYIDPRFSSSFWRRVSAH